LGVPRMVGERMKQATRITIMVTLGVLVLMVMVRTNRIATAEAEAKDRLGRMVPEAPVPFDPAKAKIATTFSRGYKVPRNTGQPAFHDAIQYKFSEDGTLKRSSGYGTKTGTWERIGDSLFVTMEDRDREYVKILRDGLAFFDQVYYLQEIPYAPVAIHHDRVFLRRNYP
jgi:hypothetical protein